MRHQADSDQTTYRAWRAAQPRELSAGPCQLSRKLAHRLPRARSTLTATTLPPSASTTSATLWTPRPPQQALPDARRVVLTSGMLSLPALRAGRPAGLPHLADHYECRAHSLRSPAAQSSETTPETGSRLGVFSAPPSRGRSLSSLATRPSRRRPPGTPAHRPRPRRSGSSCQGRHLHRALRATSRRRLPIRGRAPAHRSSSSLWRTFTKDTETKPTVAVTTTNSATGIQLPENSASRAVAIRGAGPPTIAAPTW